MATGEMNRQETQGGEIAIDPEFQALIPPLQAEELSQLKANLKRDGCRDRLVVWEECGVLLDGHHRLAICQREGLPYTTARLPFADRRAARLWVVLNQLGRRNLTPFQRAELALVAKPLLAAQAKARQIETLKRGEVKPVTQKPAERDRVSRETRTHLAKLAGISHDTIQKAEVLS